MWRQGIDDWDAGAFVRTARRRQQLPLLQDEDTAGGDERGGGEFATPGLAATRRDPPASAPAAGWRGVPAAARRVGEASLVIAPAPRRPPGVLPQLAAAGDSDQELEEDIPADAEVHPGGVGSHAADGRREGRGRGRSGAGCDGQRAGRRWPPPQHHACAHVRICVPVAARLCSCTSQPLTLPPTTRVLLLLLCCCLPPSSSAPA